MPNRVCVNSDKRGKRSGEGFKVVRRGGALSLSLHEHNDDAGELSTLKACSPRTCYEIMRFFVNLTRVVRSMRMSLRSSERKTRSGTASLSNWLRAYAHFFPLPSKACRTGKRNQQSFQSVFHPPFHTIRTGNKVGP